MSQSTTIDGLPSFGVNLRKGNDITWVIFHGESDISTLDDLDAALEHVERDGARSVHLHVTGLDFADVATVRHLTIYARRARQTGHDIMTCGASPTFRMLARLIGARADLGLL